MRNGTPFNRLVLVDDRESSTSDYNEYSTIDSGGPSDEPQPLHTEADRTRTTLLVLMSVSVACTTAAIAAGSYAAWLSRRQATRQALTDVNDLLKTCQSRMRQLEADVQNLPGRAYQ